MKCLVFLITLIFTSSPLLAQDTSTGACPLSQLDRNAISTCLNEQSQNGCEELIELNEEFKSKIRTCHKDELKSYTNKDAFDIAKGCGVGIADYAVEVVKSITSIPAQLSSAVEKTKKARALAKVICENRKQQELEKNQYAIFNTASCIDRETVEIRNVHIEWDKIQEAIETLQKKSVCFLPRYQAEVICPAVAQVMSLFVGVGSVVQGGKLLASQALTATSKVAKRGQSLLSNGRKAATKDAELRSLSHQDDLLQLTRQPEVYKQLKKNGIDRDALEMGMIDSDLGKLSAYQNKMVNGSAASREYIRFLQGKGQGPESQALREVLKDSGMNGKSLLPAHLTEQQIEKVFQSNGALNGYLHELPGIQEAVKDLKANRISKEQFKKRLAANLFHNGPQAGFWDFYTNKIMPTTMQGSHEAKSFFKGTVFEGQKIDGVYHPQYPSPISAEGIMHTMADRLSQGTRGGILKIFDEVMGGQISKNPKLTLGELKMMGPNPSANGLNQLTDLMTNNPKMTLLQMDALKKHTATLDKLTANQKSFLTAKINEAEVRLKKQSEFLQENMNIELDANNVVTKVKMKFKDRLGRQQEYVLNERTTPDQAKALVDDFLKQEERINGNAFEVKTSPPLLTAAKGTVLIPAALTCSDSILKKEVPKSATKGVN